MGSEPQVPWDVPEPDALEQQIPVLSDGQLEPPIAGPLPAEAPEADVIEQRTHAGPVTPGPAGILGAAEADAAEADLLEQAAVPPFDDEEEYPDAREGTL